MTKTLMFLCQHQEENPEVVRLVIIIAAILLGSFFVYLGVTRIFYFFEMAYVEYIKKSLFYNHLYFKKRSLTIAQTDVLIEYIKFYNRLSPRYKSYFEHRVLQILNRIEFIGKDITVTEEMKTIISATLVKLTFGLRDYKIKSVERVILYPDEFYSQTNKTLHKGEFNLGYKALVLSWKDVLHGYAIADDNLNLAVHEFTHAIHFYYMQVRRSSTSAAIFLNSYVELINKLDADDALKTKLIRSKFLRDYAYTNQYEFLSVLIETFIESPMEFREYFPGIYGKIKSMLGFNFEGY